MSEPSKHKHLSPGWIILLLALFAGMALLIAPRYIQRLQERGSYSAAPECPPGQQNTTVPTECRLVTQATVVQRVLASDVNTPGGGVQWAVVDTADHNRLEFTLPEDNIWNRLAPGNTIR